MALSGFLPLLGAWIALAITPAFARDGDLGRAVDTYFGRQELSQAREAPSHPSDRCFTSGSSSFFAALQEAVGRHFQPRRIDLSYLSQPGFDPYHLRGNSHPAPVSLLSHPFCPVDTDSLRNILSTSHSPAKLPSTPTLKRLQDFARQYNNLRELARGGQAEAGRKLAELWLRFMGCLAYVESLSDADRRESDRIAARYAPSDYRRPRGVNFYFDRGQPPESALNIGLFQFAPESGGNIQSCLREWNKEYPACAIDPRAPLSEMIHVLGSSRQAFNAYCGFLQVLNTFYTQANTSSPYGTHPFNIGSDDQLKPSAERCVSLQMHSGRAYNHFGPFQNSTGSNLEELMGCVLPD